MELLKKDMLSGRQAADYLDLADGTFFGAIEDGRLVAQGEMVRYRKMKRYIEREFAMAYLSAVKQILPPERGEGIPVFTDEAVRRLKLLNKEWDGKENVDWEHDERETDRFVRRSHKGKK